MQHALGAKNKISFIDGSIPIPDHEDLNRNAWDRCNHILHSWILNSASDSIAHTIVFHDNVILAWVDLKERFAKVDRVRISSLRSTINNLKQGNKSILEYFIELRTLWDELNCHRPIPNCTCVHPCHCDSIRLAKHYRIKDQIIQFLTGLNESFSVVKTQILLMDPLPPINKVYYLVVRKKAIILYFLHLSLLMNQASLSMLLILGNILVTRARVFLAMVVKKLVVGSALSSTVTIT